MKAYVREQEKRSNSYRLVDAGSAGSSLIRPEPVFDSRTYGSEKFTGVVADLSSIFEITKQKSKGATT